MLAMIKVLKNFINKKNGGIHPFYLEIVAITSISILIFLLAISYDFFENLYEFSRAHEEWEIDEIFSLVIIISFALIIILYKNAKYLRQENQLRIMAEKKIGCLAVMDENELVGLVNQKDLVKLGI